MDKINRLLLCHMPVYACNFKCEYCYITNQKLWDSKPEKLDYSPQKVAKAMSIERIGGIAFINICGSGETLIPHETVELVYEWAKEGHYVEIVTNGTLTNRFQEIVKFPKKLLEHITFKFSFHYLELKRLGLINEYFNNIHMIHNAGASFTVELTPYDRLEPYKSEIMELCMKELGGCCHLTIARDDMKPSIPVMSNRNFDKYCIFWSDFNSKMFEFKKEIFGKKRNEFCYAGFYSLNIRLKNGDYSKCYGSPIVGNIFRNMDKPIQFDAIGHCPLPHCYNGHAHLTLGLIPTLNTPTYYSVRNISLLDGTNSINATMKEIMEQKICDNGILLSETQEKDIYKKNKVEQEINKKVEIAKNVMKKIFQRKG